MNKKIIFLITGLLIVLTYSCKSKQSIGLRIENFDVEQSMKEDSSFFLDLSNKNLTEFPDLSEYKIKKLDLSDNKISKVIIEYFPKDLQEIDLSYNDLKDTLNLLNLESLKKVNISNNQLTHIVVENCVQSFDTSNNDLVDIFFSCSVVENSMDTLNISNNKRLNNVLTFSPKSFKKIIRENIKNDEELIWSLNMPIINTVKNPKKNKN